MPNIFRSLLGTRSKSPIIRVEIRENVMRRIKAAVARTSVETGGKFLGKIMHNEGLTIVTIETYLDSGPNASCSSNHIIPDGEYQEALFRVIERFDPEIDHIGSWHSHHSNGLSQLSTGDLQTYTESVNDPRYNANIFYVFLVVSFDGADILGRSYLFSRGQSDYARLNPEQIILLPGAYPLDSLLEKAEVAAGDTAGVKNSPSRSRTRQSGGSKAPQDTALAAIRAADNAWFHREFPDVKMVLREKRNSVSWLASRVVGETTLEVRYDHPSSWGFHPHGKLSFRCNNIALATVSIPLDEARLTLIQQTINDVIQKLEAQFAAKNPGKAGPTGSILDSQA